MSRTAKVGLVLCVVFGALVLSLWLWARNEIRKAYPPLGPNATFGQILLSLPAPGLHGTGLLPRRRTLRFPEDRSIGRLWVWVRVDEAKSSPIYSEGFWTEVGEAKGAIDIPEGHQVSIEIDPIDLEILRDFNPDDIQRLQFSKGSTLTDDDLISLSSLTGLRDLMLHGDLITDQGLSRLDPLIHLESLTFMRTAVTGKGLSHLSVLPSLRRLTLMSDKLMDEDMTEVGELRGLKGLFLFLPAITDVGLNQLKSISGLESLTLAGGSKITDAGLSPIRDLPQLRSLTLTDIPGITGSGLRDFDSLPNLESLGFLWCPIDDSSVPYISSMKSLKMLFISDTNITPAGRTALEKALPKTDILPHTPTPTPTPPPPSPAS